MPITRESVNVRSTHPTKKASVSQARDNSLCGDTSFDSSRLAGELDSIKASIQDLPTKKDIDSLKISFVDLLNEFKTEMGEKISELKEEYESKIKGMEIVNENLTKEITSLRDSNAKLKTQVTTDRQLVQEAAISCNFNEQYSRKNNVKILNFPTKPEEDLREDLIQTMKDDLGLQLHHADVTEIHRIPTKNRSQKDNPVRVRLVFSEVKRSIMHQKKSKQSACCR